MRCCFTRSCPRAVSNGPGLRCVVFVQGCDLRCPGCWNVRSHPFRGTEFAIEVVLSELVSCCRQYSLDGVTFSGGEPMQQADDLAELLQGLRSALPTLSFGMFTGYSEEELETGRYFTGTASIGIGGGRFGALSATNSISP